jgi:2-oxo-4-hydroxy-4-carboxy-5-ureidoimidazoline decarboxylase
MGLESINGLAYDQAVGELRACCAADAWVEEVLDRRPYPTPDALLDASDWAVLGLDDAGLEQALAAHARIGERRGGQGREVEWSRGEQAAALDADADVRDRLAAGNRAYEERFGRVFLIRAAGRTAEEMDTALRTRLGNDDEAERAVVLRELSEIVRLRLAELVAG